MLSHNRAWLFLLLVLTLCVFGLPQQAAAQATLDPSDLHILACSSCSGGGDPNLITTSGSIINAGGQDLSGDLLLILAAPNFDNLWASAGDVSGSNQNPWELDTDNDYGWSLPTGSGMTTGENIYDYMGLTGDNSTSFGNMQTADYNYPGSPYNSTTNPITQYGLSVFEVPDALLSKSGGNFLDFILGAGVPEGTVLAAFMYNGAVTSNPNPFVTPFTEAGLTTTGGEAFPPVPEPGTMMLLGTGLISFAGFLKKRLA